MKFIVSYTMDDGYSGWIIFPTNDAMTIVRTIEDEFAPDRVTDLHILSADDWTNGPEKIEP